MKKYKEYMDAIKASGTLHQKLVGMEEPGKRPIPWKRYGSIAAALVLVCGLGAWGLSQGGWEAVKVNFLPSSMTSTPEIADALQPDIAPEDPDAAHEPGEKTIGGYEVVSGSGPNAMVSYHVLPYIEYGDEGGTAAALDWDIPQGATQRYLAQEEIVSMMGGQDAVDAHLDWGGYELSGWAAWYEDGSFWGAYLQGHQGPLDHFEFAVTADQLPPTCIAYAESVTQEVRGLTVTADGCDSVASEQGGVDASTRRVSFMKDNYGYRFDITGVSRALTEERVSRLVARVADEGLALWTVDESLETYTCHVCGEVFSLDELRTHVYSHVDSFDTCSSCGEFVPRGIQHLYLISNGDGAHTCDSCGLTVQDGVKHYHVCTGYPVPSVCPNCGETYPEGTAHDCDLCGLPVPTVCPDCGEAYPTGWAHHCEGGTSTCPDCGATYQTGTEHHCELCGLPLAPEGWTGPDEEGPDVIAETIYCD